jgi:two-component sensor histidine kinase
VIPVGLVLNELISNALKYAFCDKEQGVLRITFKNSEDGMLLQVRDNGKGFPKGMNIYQSPSFGYKLIKTFAQKLKAKLEVYNDDGACVMLHIRKMKAS